MLRFSNQKGGVLSNFEEWVTVPEVGPDHVHTEQRGEADLPSQFFAS